MRLLATGSNAHGQLNDSREDLDEFTRIADEVDAIELSTWSTLTWTTRSALVTQGHQAFSEPIASHSRVHCVVGDHNGILGLLCGDKLWYAERTDALSKDVALRDCTTACSPSLSHIAVASNGHTVAMHKARLDTMTQTGLKNNQDGMLVSIFSSFDAMRAWYSDATSTTSIPQHQYTVSGRPRQLVAGATSFAILTEDGSMHNWGEARRCSLGRSIVGEDGKNNAHKPGVVQALAGVRIEKICHGGWMFGAVSADGAAYIWGLDMPRDTNAIGDMASDDEVTLIELASGQEEEPDVVDMDIGEGHAALVTSTGLLYAIGENGCGQLGRAMSSGAASRWIRHPEIDQAKHVLCGPDSTIVLSR